MIVTAVKVGRGAWPVSGAGGTLDQTKARPGPYYAAPPKSLPNLMPGLAGALAFRNNGTCDANQQAVWLACKAIQRAIGLTGAAVDGIIGPNSDGMFREWQFGHGLVADGLLGPKTSRQMWDSLITQAVSLLSGSYPAVGMVTTGTVGHESLWDAGAVGGSTPLDKGLGQINLPSHPAVSVEEAFMPSFSILYVANLVQSNFVYMKGVMRDAIAAYNLGKGGASSWIRAGRPDVWVRTTTDGRTLTTDVEGYIGKVLAAATA